MRIYWYYTNSGEIEFGAIEGMPKDYDKMLKVFLLANESALKRKDGEGEELDKQTLEEAIDDDPELFFELSEALSNSKVFEKVAERAEVVEDEKKQKK
jgi:hypothetical protein